eukprot:jgi/Mesvir1/4480/Mv04413-RA.1
MLSGTANVGKKALGWVRGSVGACASGIGKTLTREQIERLVVTLYKELPAAFIKKTPTPTLCILVGDEVVGRLLMNMCKQALQGSPDAHERLVHIAFMLTKTSKDVLFRIPKEYLCEIISRATNTTQRVAMLQNTVDFHKKFGNEDFRDLGMRAGRAFANEAGDGPYDMQGGRGGGGRGGMPMFVNNVYPRGPIRRGNAGGGGNAAVYFNAPPNQNPWTHYGGQARTAHQAACCQVVQSAVNNAHRMRAESIAGALNPYTKVGKTEEPSPGVPGSSKDGNALRGDKVFGPGRFSAAKTADKLCATTVSSSPSRPMESSALITCPSCGKQKAPEGFNNRSLRLHGPCRECRAEDNKKFKASKEGYFRHLIRNLATARKKSARKTSLSISLFVRDLVEIWETQGGKCAITGINMTHGPDAEVPGRSAVIDVIDPSREISRSNVRLVCRKVKRMKGNDDVESFRNFCALVAKASDDAALDGTDFEFDTADMEDDVEEPGASTRQRWADEEEETV